LAGDFSEKWLLAGKVIRPHGLRGLLRIWSYAVSRETFLNSGTVLLKSGSGEPFEYRLESVEPYKKFFLMKLQGLNSIEEAEKLRNAAVFVRKDSLKDKGEDEYYWHELLGMSVYLDTGKFLGKIEHILPTGSNDIYIIVRQESRGELLIPAIHDVVKEIDPENKKMIISEMEGLFDLNEA